ncbi:hypothetical protein CH373_16255 [Leptospira perolatii]|uniref:Uncharacterized protein n=1 Tax=Leptospira perolatii TaxID=2023191 RepID=A0A2M9ZJ87_9LEPT|nr:DUF6789 family protein [Leptospira perolatii]PJZ69498.1 hypothetical protein CH360_10855 [Leptospira perolatii]PJZ72013.1 hypothetical protein CH373_16255 [Leptospira perolatii]
METIGLVLAAGTIGTSAMSVVMWSISYAGSINADMVRAIGSFFTKRLDSALIPGIVTHLIIGFIFAFPYTFIISLAPHILTASILTGGVLGFMHGYVVGFLLVALVAQHHPLPEFRQAGIGVAAAHVFGHMVYGVSIGLVVGLTNLDYSFILEIK